MYIGFLCFQIAFLRKLFYVTVKSYLTVIFWLTLCSRDSIYKLAQPKYILVLISLAVFEQKSIDKLHKKEEHFTNDFHIC